MLPFLDQMPIDEEENKFTILYEKYFNALLAYARSIVKSDTLAEDVVQEAYKRLLKNLHKVNISECMKTKAYLVKIVRNVAVDIYNKNLKMSALDIDEYNDVSIMGSFDPTWEIYEAQALASDLEKWISQLSDREQLLLRYKVLGEWTYQEIEDSFGIKEPTASSIVSRAKKKLLTMYEKERGANHGCASQFK